MSDAESNSTHQDKKQKMNDCESHVAVAVPVAGPLNLESPSPIFKINVDCFEELFEWLSVNDLLAIRRTCKHLKKVVDHYIHTRYARCMKIKLSDKTIEHLRQMDSGSIELIKKMNVSIESGFDCTQFSAIKELLSKVQEITIDHWKSNPDIYNIFLKYCKNLKCLSMVVYIDNEWLSHQYPSLEYISFDVSKFEFDVLKTFFHLNPNIHALSTYFGSLKDIGSRFVAAGIKFDRLYTDDSDVSEECVNILKKLHDEGFYKRLHISSESIEADDYIDDPEESEVLSKFSVIGLECVHHEYLHYVLPPIPTLKELNFDQAYGFDEKENKNVVNVLERLNIDCNFHDILAFVGNCPKLKYFLTSCYDRPTVIDLIELNKAREKLAGACKTTIYVGENVFLATKWAGKKTNLNLIELKRSQECDWDQLFENKYTCGQCRS